MKQISLIVILMVALNANAQITIFGSYKIDHATVQTAENLNDKYRWIATDAGFVMRFPQTSDGMENLNNKLHYILLLNDLNIDEPTWDKTLILFEDKKEKSLRALTKLLLEKKIVINRGWKLDNKQISITLFSGHFIILIESL